MEKDSVKVEVNLNTEDVYRFQKSYTQRSLSPIAITMLCIVFIMLTIVILISDVAITVKLLKLALLIIIPAAIVAFIMLWLKLHSKNVFKNYKLLQKTHGYTINDEGIGTVSESGQFNVKWNELYKAIETKEDYQLYISKRQAYIIPKRCFPDDGQIELMRGLIANAPIPREEKNRKRLFRNVMLGIALYISIFAVVLIIMLYIKA